MKICCTTCEREMDFTKDETDWVTVAVADGDAYACSSICALRLGHSLAKEEYKAIIEDQYNDGNPRETVPPPCVRQQAMVN